MDLKSILIGREAMCPDGLGRITKVIATLGGRVTQVRVQTYVNDRSCVWAADNVKLIKIEFGKLCSDLPYYE